MYFRYVCTSLLCYSPQLNNLPETCWLTHSILLAVVSRSASASHRPPSLPTNPTQPQRFRSNLTFTFLNRVSQTLLPLSLSLALLSAINLTNPNTTFPNFLRVPERREHITSHRMFVLKWQRKDDQSINHHCFTLLSKEALSRAPSFLPSSLYIASARVRAGLYCMRRR